MDIAVAGVASFITFEPDNKVCREARIALGAVAPTPVRVPDAENILRGKILSSKRIAEAAEKTAELPGRSPISGVQRVIELSS